MNICDIKLSTMDRRCSEPVSCGIPWAVGVLDDVSRLVMRDGQGRLVPLQARVLNRWADGSIRWVLLDWQASLDSAESYRVSADGPAKVAERGGRDLAAFHNGGVRIDTGVAQFQVRPGEDFPFSSTAGAAGGVRVEFEVEDEAGRSYRAHISRVTLTETGPIRASVDIEGQLLGENRAASLAEVTLRLHFFADSATVRFALTLRNSRRARHHGGLWELGDEGSTYLKRAVVCVTLPSGVGPAILDCSPESTMPVERLAVPFELYQDSSGGSNWNSSNHVNRQGVVPNTFRGYRLRSDSIAERTGLRATPVVNLERSDHAIAVAVPHFWENFPKAIEADGETIRIGLFPGQYSDVHELQGGEQKTHTFTIAFGRDQVSDLPLQWCREPLQPHVDPTWYCSTDAVPYLTPRSLDPNPEYLSLVDSAIDGKNSFVQKREVIDEYGWRHFGDIYGDHEAVFHDGPSPLVSHYNNQYDAIAGFACQYLRSGDVRWWRQMNELASHTADIDIYNTNHDKPGYNKGLFWHTFHYVDAGPAHHRTYPRDPRVNGGGPSDEHNYAAGLALHHFLTGDPSSREAAIGLAQWVIDMDDGSKTIFRWLDRGATGLASASRTPDYNGPGRGGANSIATLIEGHRLTDDSKFLAKADELIRRCIHPEDDIDARNLLDAENRWFYTMFLQSLGKYLDYKEKMGDLDRMYAYARACLLRYARWMADHEYPYLDKPEILEYPTETWAAQDMRKSDVFKFAAKHTSGEERSRFLERSEFFFGASTKTLCSLPTRTLARPIVLMLSNGYMHAYFQQHPDVTAPPPAEELSDFGRPECFVPQKIKAIRKAKLLIVGMAVFVAMGLSLVAWRWLS